MTTTRAASLLLLAVLSAACASRKGDAAPGSAHESPASRRQELRREIVGYRTVWLRGSGKIGFVKSYAVSEGTAEPVVIHFCEDVDNIERGWVGDDGQGVKYASLENRTGAARREAFDAQDLPVDSLENQVRRILGLDPLADIALLETTRADLAR
jgi:hypothetical protein